MVEMLAGQYHIRYTAARNSPAGEDSFGSQLICDDKAAKLTRNQEE
jgi:hypothetical protein